MGWIISGSVVLIVIVVLSVFGPDAIQLDGHASGEPSDK